MKWGNDIGDNEMLDFSEVDKHGFNDTFHSFYRDNEADDLFKGLNILHKGKTSFEYTYNDEKAKVSQLIISYKKIETTFTFMILIYRLLIV